MSRVPGSAGRNPFHLPSLTPGTLGCNDAADPNASLHLADTPGSLGRNDCADPDADSPLQFGIGKLFMTLSLDKDLGVWDYDPQRLLEDDRLCPEFVREAHRGLSAAVAGGLRPRVHQAFRSPEESDALHKKYKEGKGGRAAPGWMSVHNYGLAMDVWLYDRRNKYIDNHVKGWYKLYTQLAKYLSGFLWGAPFDDSDHFEYHPSWPKPAKGEHLMKAREWAMRAAVKSNKLVSYDALAPEARFGGAKAQSDFIDVSDIDWLPYFWWALGAEESNSPSNAYLATSPAPVQS